jgi:hypothetical protein
MTEYNQETMNTKQTETTFVKKPYNGKKYEGYTKYNKNTEGFSDKKFVREPRVFTPEEQAKHENKKQAFSMAQELMSDVCWNACSEKFCASVEENLQYTVGYKATRTLDVTNDDLVVEHNGETYTFSKKRFLEHKTFQYKVRERLKPYMPSAWIRFFQGRDENTFCIGFYPLRK